MVSQSTLSQNKLFPNSTCTVLYRNGPRAFFVPTTPIKRNGIKFKSVTSILLQLMWIMIIKYAHIYYFQRVTLMNCQLILQNVLQSKETNSMEQMLQHKFQNKTICHLLRNSFHHLCIPSYYFDMFNRGRKLKIKCVFFQ
eukprot:NODE_490_length_6857_cov_0.383249.p6 type:complete len:140 gc:universal NODE_490_length_6857_cov_0.383249:2617-3036(+)